MRLLTTLALASMLVIPSLAIAQTPNPDDLVLIPRALINPLTNVILHPSSLDTGGTLQLLQQLEACVNDNPVGGVVRHAGPDQCKVVTDALDAQKKPVVDVKPEATKK